MINFIKRLFIREKPQPIKEKFNHKKRKDGDTMSDKDKMDKGFNGKTYTINGIEGDF
jgi:hypothetical protein